MIFFAGNSRIKMDVLFIRPEHMPEIAEMMLHQ